MAKKGFYGNESYVDYLNFTCRKRLDSGLEFGTAPRRSLEKEHLHHLPSEGSVHGTA